MIKVKVTLTDAEGQRLKSKVTKKFNHSHILQVITLTYNIHGTKVYNKAKKN